MAEIESAKLISYVKIDFSTEAELELYVNMFEKEGEGFWLQLKEIGLLRWRVNRVWNKRGGFELSQIFEYKDEGSFVKGQELLGDILESKRTSLARSTSSGLHSEKSTSLTITNKYLGRNPNLKCD